MKKLNMRNKRWMGITLAASAMLMAACGNGEETDTGNGANGGETAEVEKDTLYIGVTNPMGNLSPINGNSVSTRWAQNFYFDTLIQMTEPLVFEPKLADSFETTDNQNYTIKLNPDAKWSDGTPITADDVVFTFNLIANPEVQTIGLHLTSLEGVNESNKLESGT